MQQLFYLLPQLPVFLFIFWCIPAYTYIDIHNYIWTYICTCIHIFIACICLMFGGLRLRTATIKDPTSVSRQIWICTRSLCFVLTIFVCTVPPGTVLIPIELNLSYQNYANLSCSVPIGFPERTLICWEFSPTGAGLFELDVTKWQRPIGCLIFIGHFPQKSPIISGSSAKNDMQLNTSYGSSPPCRAFSISPCSLD